MVTFRFDHIHLRSPDPMKSAQFYHKMFGARIIETPQPSGPNRIDLDINGLTIFLAGALPQGQETQGLRDAHYGPDHFGLGVVSLEKAVAELKTRGADFTVEPRTLPTGVKIAYLRGPDGVRVELLERAA